MAGGKAFDEVYVRLLHLIQELASVKPTAIRHIAGLALSVESCRKSERGTFPSHSKHGDHYQFVSRGILKRQGFLEINMLTKRPPILMKSLLTKSKILPLDNPPKYNRSTVVKGKGWSRFG